MGWEGVREGGAPLPKASSEEGGPYRDLWRVHCLLGLRTQSTEVWVLTQEVKSAGLTAVGQQRG